MLESQSWLRCSPTCVGQDVTSNSNLARVSLILYLNLLTHTSSRSQRTDTPLSYSAHSLPLSVHFLNSALTHVHFALKLLTLHTLLLSAHIPPALINTAHWRTDTAYSCYMLQGDDSVSGRQLEPGAHFFPLFVHTPLLY